MGFGIFGAILGALVGGIGELFGADSQNKQIEKAKKEAKTAADLRAKQADEAAQLDRQRKIRDAARTRGAILANFAESGFDPLSTDLGNLLDENTSTAGLNLSIIDANLANDLALIQSERRANEIRLNAGKKSPILSSITGALQGASAGASIGGFFDQAAETSAQEAATAAMKRGDRPETPFEYVTSVDKTILELFG